MARWIALGLTLLCFASCSMTSTSPLRGVFAPLAALLLGLVTGWLFIADRVSGSSRSEGDLMQDPETLRLLRERAARTAERNRRPDEASANPRHGFAEPDDR